MTKMKVEKLIDNMVKKEFEKSFYKERIRLIRFLIITGILIFVLFSGLLFWTIQVSGKLDFNQSSWQADFRPRLAVEEKIEYWANVFGVDAGLAKQIALCESGYQNVCNSNGCQYGQGIYQFVPSTWRNYTEDFKNADVFDKNLNILVAMRMLSNGEYYHWAQSSRCWK